jgi:L-asparaginase/Glu-tRNA(Gln) amidotransferase subunit D
MAPNAEGVLMPPTDPNQFLKVAPELKQIVDFDFFPLMNEDSTNIVPTDWITMANAVYEKRNDGYVGFVIAHGTDTMHFSSSALAFALGPDLDFPVVFTGAQTTPDVPHGDARINLLRAAKVALSPIAEVVICFGNFVFRGCRTQKKDEKKFDAFESPALYPIGDITEKIILHPTAKTRGDGGEIQLEADFAGDIIQVGLIPGMKADLLIPIISAKTNKETRNKNVSKKAKSDKSRKEHLSSLCSGIVLQSFGAGNVPDKDGYAFGDFIRSAVAKGIPVIITSQFPANSTLETRYGPGVAAVNAGAIPTGNMTSAAATVKFRWALARVDKEIKNGNLSPSARISRIREIMDAKYVDEMD